MENNENKHSNDEAGKERKRQSILVTEGETETLKKESLDPKTKLDRIKKPVIFTVMGVAFIGCMYMLFSPSDKKLKDAQAGLNDAVPQATGGGLQSDKQKAYEQDMLEQKEKQKKDALMSLSDYWSEEQSVTKDSTAEADTGLLANAEGKEGANAPGNAALNSYKNIQNDLGSFYQDNSEAQSLKEEVAALKQQLEEKDDPQPYSVDNQLALMEKSYEMASRYFPAGTQQNQAVQNDSALKKDTRPPGIPVYTTKKNVVSILHRQSVDNAQLESWNENRNMRFFTSGSQENSLATANSIKACIHETQTVTGDDGVRIRLLEDTRIQGMTIPKGNLLTAIARFQSNRLQLIVTSVEYQGNILPVEITAYDTDGQPGLYVPYSPERSAFTEVVANMGSNAGTSVSLSSTPGQQIASDLSRSAVQGISGYFAKKVRTPKVTLKTGHRLLLVSKK